MEQKKILWVVLSISFFVVIIFGVAIYLYAPFRNKSTVNSMEIADLGSIENNAIEVDPVKWTREPDSIPPLEKENENPVNIQNTITVVNGEVEKKPEEGLEASENQEDKNAVSVGDLIENKENEKETTALPENLAKQLGEDNSDKEEEKVAKNTNSGVKAKKGTLAPKNKTKKKKVRKQKRDTKLAAKPKKLPSRSATKASRTQKHLSKKAIETIYWVQTASLTSHLNAENARKTLTAKHMKAQIFTKKTGTGLTYRVRVGPFKNKTEAEYWLKKIRDMKGFERSYVSQGKQKN